jgi:hypothetical protein
MSKKLRFYVWDVAAREFYSGSIAKGTVIPIAKGTVIRIPHHGSRTTQVAPPKVAEFLLTALATTPRANAMIGDLNERLADEIQKLGRDRAVRLYWARTLHSLWPLLRRAIGKAVKWGAVIAAVRRHF